MLVSVEVSKANSCQQKHRDNIIWLDLLSRLKARLDLARNSFHKHKTILKFVILFELNSPPYVVPNLYDLFFILWNTKEKVSHIDIHYMYQNIISNIKISSFCSREYRFFPYHRTNTFLHISAPSICCFFTTADVEWPVSV